MPTALSTVYCVVDDLAAILSQAKLTLHVDDDSLQSIVNQGINWATSRVNDYAAGRYDAADLVNSWTANYWTAVLACHFVCMRRMNPVPTSIRAIYTEVMADMKELREGKYSFGDIPSRIVDSPAWSNVRVPVWYLGDRIRVERRRSEGTPRRIVPPLDVLSEFLPREPP